MKQFINLTPHAIRIRSEENPILEPLETDIVVEPSGTLARITQESQEAPSLFGIRVMKTRLKEIKGLPQPQNGVIYIVSALVAESVAGSRDDVFSPDTSPTGGAIRYSEGALKGQPYAVRGLQQFV